MECGIGHGLMIDGDGPWFFTTCKRGSNWIVQSRETYPNGVKANSVFEDRLRKASLVRELNDKRLADGRVVKRAVAGFRNTQTGQRFTSIIWVDERSVVSISSTSRYYALLAEWWE